MLTPFRENGVESVPWLQIHTEMEWSLDSVSIIGSDLAVFYETRMNMILPKL